MAGGKSQAIKKQMLPKGQILGEDPQGLIQAALVTEGNHTRPINGINVRPSNS